MSFEFVPWPRGTPNYWALQAEFKDKYGYDLGVPADLEQLKTIAQFFHDREIDGKTVYGAAINTDVAPRALPWA